MYASTQDVYDGGAFGEGGEDEDFDVGSETVYFADQVGGSNGLAEHGEVEDDQVGGGFAEGGEESGGVRKGGDGVEIGGLPEGGFEHGADERMVVYDDDAGHKSSGGVFLEGF